MAVDCTTCIAGGREILPTVGEDAIEGELIGLTHCAAGFICCAEIKVDGKTSGDPTVADQAR